MGMNRVIDTVQGNEVQRRYALFLAYGSRFSFLFLVLCFTVYLCGVLPADIVFEELAHHWSLPLDTFLKQVNSPTGWDWITHPARGESACLAGIALLAGCSIPCLIAACFSYLKQQDKLYALLCVLQIIVLLLAASGILIS